MFALLSSVYRFSSLKNNYFMTGACFLKQNDNPFFVFINLLTGNIFT